MHKKFTERGFAEMQDKKTLKRINNLLKKPLNLQNRK